MGTKIATPRPMGGFTLVELMVVLAVAAILLTIGVPSFQSIIQSNRTASQTNELVSALNLARAEAVRRGRTVSLCANTGGLVNGFYVEEGTGCNDSNIIRSFGAMSRMTTGGPAQIAFDARGVRTTPGGTDNTVITLTPANCPDGASDRARTITVRPSGQINTRPMNC